MSNARNLSRLPQLGAGNATSMKNRIINGAMVIDQRNAGASKTISADTYTLDRWQAFQTQASKFSVQQNAGSVTPPAGFTNYLGVTSLAATTVGSSDYFVFSQGIEGYNFADLNWGSANAKTITLSFWVRSSLTGTFGVAFRNDNADRNYQASYTINSANTWEQKSITVAGDTTGTWTTTNGAGLRVGFGLGVGSTYSTTAGAWSAGNLFGLTGATSVVGTNGATFYITGVQLEVGTAATSFDVVDYGRSLIQCQRYYETGGIAGASVQFSGNVTNSNTYYTTIPFIVTKRTSPTVVNTNSNNSNFGTTSTSFISSTEVRNARSATGTGVGLFGDSWTASAEL